MPPPPSNSDLTTRLQAAIGDNYRITKELGGGGMSRVFLADEVRLGRKVVIKVLPPEMGAGVNIERFGREIQLAARLQHPHIVPLLSAGAEGDLLYYTMPFIQGESLRAKLAREGELPVSEALRILKEVADALAYAHAEGVVHRDIKPDNVLLSGRHAVVTDFGVAKAVSASTGESSLTSLGVALGTPAYMSPEQAAANPNVDHRADIYALGAVAYEMVCGRPPFSASNPQAMLAAHVTQAPDAPTSVRSTIPPALNELILRCLAKLPADRPQKADELIPHFDALLTPTGGITPTATQPVPSVEALALARKAHPVRVGALFALASVGVLAIVYGVTQAIGLPGWVFWGAIGLLLVGLPVMLLTGHHERRRALASTTGMHVTPAGLQRHFTWRKALLGGGLAFATLGALTGGYMAMRSLGIGPAGTLVASGVLAEHDRVLLTQFENRTDDPTLGRSVTDLLRVDLAQSPLIKLVDPSAVEDVLRRMERDPNAGLDLPTAREVAQREGIPAIVAGDIVRVGGSYALTVNLISGADGEVLTAVRETASDDGDIIGAVDRVSAKLRERIGESFRAIRRTEPLQRVTTNSLEALRKLSQASDAEDEGDVTRAITLLEEAVALDTAFAMAYRKLAVVLSNSGVSRARTIAASTKAFEHRDRLPPVERYLTEAFYYDDVVGDRDRVITAYRSVLAADSSNWTALNNLALELNEAGGFAEAESLASRAIHARFRNWPIFMNLARAQVGQGKWAAAETTVTMGRAESTSPWLVSLAAFLQYARGDVEEAERMFRGIGETEREAVWRARAHQAQASLAMRAGRLADARRHLELAMQQHLARGSHDGYLDQAAVLALMELRLRGEPSAALALLARARDEVPLADVDPVDRPYGLLAAAYAGAGRIDEAKRLLAEHRASVDEQLWAMDETRHIGAGAVAFAEQRFDDAVAAFRMWQEENPHVRLGVYEVAVALDAAGAADSALATYERATTAPDLFAIFADGLTLPPSYMRMGELYEQHGERERAVEYYTRFVDLWAAADPELQPVVRDVRERIARLVGEGR